MQRFACELSSVGIGRAAGIIVLNRADFAAYVEKYYGRGDYALILLRDGRCDEHHAGIRIERATDPVFPPIAALADLVPEMEASRG